MVALRSEVSRRVKVHLVGACSELILSQEMGHSPIRVGAPAWANEPAQ